MRRNESYKLPEKCHITLRQLWIADLWRTLQPAKAVNSVWYSTHLHEIGQIYNKGAKAVPTCETANIWMWNTQDGTSHKAAVEFLHLDTLIHYEVCSNKLHQTMNGIVTVRGQSALGARRNKITFWSLWGILEHSYGCLGHLPEQLPMCLGLWCYDYYT